MSPQLRRPALATPAAGSITPHEEHDEASAAQVAAEVEHHRQRYRRAVERAHELRLELARCHDDRLDALGRLATLGRSPWWPEHAHRHPEAHPRPSVVPGPVLARALRGLERVRRLEVELEVAA